MNFYSIISLIVFFIVIIPVNDLRSTLFRDGQVVGPLDTDNLFIPNRMGGNPEKLLIWQCYLLNLH